MPLQAVCSHLAKQAKKQQGFPDPAVTDLIYFYIGGLFAIPFAPTPRADKLGTRRLLRAFPDMKSLTYAETLASTRAGVRRLNELALAAKIAAKTAAQEVAQTARETAQTARENTAAAVQTAKETAANAAQTAKDKLGK